MSVRLVVIENLGVSHWRQLLGHESAQGLRAILGECSRKRIDVVPSAGRLGIAATMATGVCPQEHGVTGVQEPDGRSNEVRRVDGHSWRYEPFWSLLSNVGLSSCVIGWPAVEPTRAFSGEGTDHFQLIASASYDVRSDPQGAWLLPPETVYPDELRPLVRASRVHQDELKEDQREGAAHISAHAIGQAVCAQSQPDVIAYWLVHPMGQDKEKRMEAPLRLAQTVQSIFESSNDEHVVLVILPMLHGGRVLARELQSGLLYFQSPALDFDALPMVMSDTDLAPMLFQMLGLDFQAVAQSDQSSDEYGALVDQRARRLLKVGMRPRKTPGQQRVFQRFIGNRHTMIGLDLLLRNDYKAARQWLEAGAQSNLDVLLYLIDALVGDADVDRLQRVSSIDGVPPLLRTYAKVLALTIQGDKKQARDLIEAIDPQTPIESALRGELYFRVGDLNAAAKDFQKAQKYLIRFGSTRQVRMGLIAARQSEMRPLAQKFAMVLLGRRPLEVRRRRFLARA